MKQEDIDLIKNSPFVVDQNITLSKAIDKLDEIRFHQDILDVFLEPLAKHLEDKVKYIQIERRYGNTQPDFMIRIVPPEQATLLDYSYKVRAKGHVTVSLLHQYRNAKVYSRRCIFETNGGLNVNGNEISYHRGNPIELGNTREDAIKSLRKKLTSFKSRMTKRFKAVAELADYEIECHLDKERRKDNCWKEYILHEEPLVEGLEIKTDSPYPTIVAKDRSYTYDDLSVTTYGEVSTSIQVHPRHLSKLANFLRTNCDWIKSDLSGKDDNIPLRVDK